MAALLSLSPSFSPPSTCSDAVVGGGWSGVYFAYRRALASSDPSSICLFEASERIGGRTYSVPAGALGHGFTLDVGAYRFSPDMHLPGDLILHDLKLPTACYEPSCPPAQSDFPPPFLFNYSAPLRRIVDDKTQLPAGYATAIQTMLDKLDSLKAKVFVNAALIDFVPSTTTTSLTFHSGGAPPGSSNADMKVVAKGVVMLNLPRNKLLMMRDSLVKARLSPRTLKMLECVSFDAPAKLFHNISIGHATGLTKAYIYYDDAWWYTKTNTTIGHYPKAFFTSLFTSYGIPISIHWNDGPVLCTREGEDAATSSFKPSQADLPLPPNTKCRGYLETYYAATNETFYYGLSGAPKEPLGIVNAAPPYDHHNLKLAHEAVLEAIDPILQEKGLKPTEIPQPSQLVVGVWSRPGVVKHDEGYTAPTKVYWAPSVSGSAGKACGVDGLTDDEYRTTVLQPFGKDVPIYLANNDYVCQDVRYFFGDWAEETLLQAERALYRLKVPRPSWLNASYYAAKIVAKA